MMIRCVAFVLGLLMVTMSSAFAQATDQLRMARVYEQAGDYRNAARIYLDVYESGTRTSTVFDGIARTLTALEQFTALYPIAEAEFARQPSASVAQVAALAAARSGNLTNAHRWWDEASTLISARAISERDKSILMAQLAADQESVRLYDRAIGSYLTARTLSGDATEYALPLADLYGAVGKVSEAVREILRGYEQQGRLVVAIGRLAALLAKGASADEMATVLESAGSTPEMLEVQAWFYGEIGNWEQAYARTEQLDRLRNAQGRDLLQFANRAKAAQAPQAYDAALRALESIIDGGGPLALSATYSYTRTLDQRMIETDSLSAETAQMMIERYRSIATDNPRHPIAADALLRCAELVDDVLHNTDEARQILTQLTNRWNGTEAAAQGRLRLADLYIAAGRPDAARDVLRPLRDVSAAAPATMRDYADAAALQLADLELFAGAIDHAMQLYTELSAQPTSVAANDALERLGLLMLRIDDSVSVQQMIRALAARQARRIDSAISIYSATATTTSSKDVADLCWVSAATLSVRAADDQSAARLIEPVIARIPESLVGDRALALIAEIYERRGQTDDAISALTTLLVQYPLSILAPTARDQIRRLRAE